MLRDLLERWLEEAYGENKNPHSFMQLLAVNGLADSTPVYTEKSTETYTANVVGEMVDMLADTFSFAEVANYDFFSLLSETGGMMAEPVHGAVDRTAIVRHLASALAGAANDNAPADDFGPVRAA